MNTNLFIKISLILKMVLIIIYAIGCSHSGGLSSGSIKGVIQDITGNALENARVHIECVSTSTSLPGRLDAITRIVTTHTDGSFVVSDLPSGTWQIGMLVEGYQTPQFALGFQTEGAVGAIQIMDGVTPELSWPVADSNYPVYIEDGLTFQLPLIYVTKREGSLAPGNVSGKVINMIDGGDITTTATTPVIVSAYKGGEDTPTYTVLANGLGEFEFSGLSEGPWRIKAFRDNYDENNGHSEINLNIVGGSTLTDIQLPVEPLTINLVVNITDDSSYGTATGDATINNGNIRVFCKTTGQVFDTIGVTRIRIDDLAILSPNNMRYEFSVFHINDPERFNVTTATGNAGTAMATLAGNKGFSVTFATEPIAGSTYTTGSINLRVNTVSVLMQLFIRGDETDGGPYDLQITETDGTNLLRTFTESFTVVDPDNNDNYCYLTTGPFNAVRGDSKTFQITGGLGNIDINADEGVFPDDINSPSDTSTARAYLTDTFIGISLEVK